jgi:hypothetical protein
MKTYIVIVPEITESEKIYADKLKVNKAGQVILKKDNQTIAVLPKKSYIIEQGATEKIYSEEIEKTKTRILKQIHEIDENFGNDLFLKEKNNDLAYKQLRKIHSILIQELETILNKL